LTVKLTVWTMLHYLSASSSAVHRRVMTFIFSIELTIEWSEAVASFIMLQAIYNSEEADGILKLNQRYPSTKSQAYVKSADI
jgi:hypothetical protein